MLPTKAETEGCDVFRRPGQIGKGRAGRRRWIRRGAMMMKPAQRSAMWPPSTTIQATADSASIGYPEPHRRRRHIRCTARSPTAHSRDCACRQARRRSRTSRTSPSQTSNADRIRRAPAVRAAVVARPGKTVLPDLHRGVGNGKPQPAPVERRRDRGRQHKPAQRQRGTAAAGPAVFSGSSQLVIQEV